MYMVSTKNDPPITITSNTISHSFPPPRALGAPTSNPEIHTQYPLAFRSAFFPTLTPGKTPKPFHFILVSGVLVVRDQTTRLPPFLSALKQRGVIESDFVDFEAKHPDVWKTFVARPSMVVAEGSWMGSVMPGAVAIGVGILGRALVRLAVEGGEQTVGNGGLRSMGMER
jgi:hypothetical protein